MVIDAPGFSARPAQTLVALRLGHLGIVSPHPRQGERIERRADQLVDVGPLDRERGGRWPDEMRGGPAGREVRQRALEPERHVHHHRAGEGAGELRLVHGIDGCPLHRVAPGLDAGRRLVDGDPAGELTSGVDGFRRVRALRRWVAEDPEAQPAPGHVSVTIADVSWTNPGVIFGAGWAWKPFASRQTFTPYPRRVPATSAASTSIASTGV